MAEMKLRALLGLLVLCIWAAPAPARAEATCDGGYAQGLIRQGFQYLDTQRWHDAHRVANQLALYGSHCNDNLKVQNSIAVYNLYFNAVSLHGMGYDGQAVEAFRAGVAVLEQLKKQGGFTSLYDAMMPMFVELRPEIPGA